MLIKFAAKPTRAKHPQWLVHHLSPDCWWLAISPALLHPCVPHPPWMANDGREGPLIISNYYSPFSFSPRDWPPASFFISASTSGGTRPALDWRKKEIKQCLWRMCFENVLPSENRRVGIPFLKNDNPIIKNYSRYRIVIPEWKW